jgi:hypothetical protein
MTQLEVKRKEEKNPYIKRRWSRELKKAHSSLDYLSSLQGSPGIWKWSTNGRNPSRTNPWRVLRVDPFLPLLGLEVPKGLSPLKSILHFSPTSQGSWKGWKIGLGPYPGEGPGF